ncbi:MAG: 50S ribosomal protein L25 [Deltaproteobacteria bacterium]
MERPVLVVETREGLKKGNARKLRAKGLIPAVFYGPRSKTLPLVLDPKELSRALKTEAGANVLIDLDIRNADQLGRKVVMVKDIQLHPLQREILHADFYEVAMDEMVNVEVPIHLIGKSEGVKAGGILEQVRRVIEIQCLPADIPKFIEVDVTALQIGDSIHVQSIQIEKAKILAETNFTIATVVPPAAEEKKVVEEEVAEAAAEGEVKEETKEKEKEKKEKKEEEK